MQYRIVNARDFISDMHEKYAHYKSDKTINTMLKKLEYTMRIGNKKIEEIEAINEDMQARLSELFKRHMEEMEDTTTYPTNIKAQPAGAQASVGHTTVSKVKSTPRNKMILGKNHLVPGNDARFGGDDNTCNSNGDDQQSNGNRNQPRTKKHFYWNGERNSIQNPNKAYWNGDRTQLRSFLQQWHVNLKGFTDKKALAILVNVFPLSISTSY